MREGQWNNGSNHTNLKAAGKNSRPWPSRACLQLLNPNRRFQGLLRQKVRVARAQQRSWAGHRKIQTAQTVANIIM